MSGCCLCSTSLQNELGLQNLSKHRLQNLSKQGLQKLSNYGARHLFSYSKPVLFCARIERIPVLNIKKSVKISAVDFKSSSRVKKIHDIHPKNDEMVCWLVFF